MNGRFFRCLASLGFSIMQQLLRCARMQRENQIHSMGSSGTFAAICTNGCFSEIERLITTSEADQAVISISK